MNLEDIAAAVLSSAARVSEWNQSTAATFLNQEDPFAGVTADSMPLWDTAGGSGLQLDVWNALEDPWIPYLQQAVSDWDSGTPDALRLTIIPSEPDPSCQPVSGVLKVCNGNYSETLWWGVNSILLSNGSIVASSIRLNDYYFDDTPASNGSRSSTSNGTRDGYRRRYTMCHELGHGLGLPHRDEDSTNRDVGNCMDLTIRPENNLLPGQSSFELLASKYGLHNNEQGSERRRTASAAKMSLPTRIRQAVEQLSANDSIPQTTGERKGWNTRHKSDRGQTVELNLDDDFILVLFLVY